MTFARLVLFLVLSPRVQEGSGAENMVLIHIKEAVLAGIKILAAVDVRIFTGERHAFGVSAALSTRATSLNIGRAGGSDPNSS